MFHFVDRILELEPGKRALGVRHVAADDPFLRMAADGRVALYSCIIGEALGQLGAWNVMFANGFRLRPVAGIVRGVVIHGEVEVGETLVLETTIDSVDEELVAYHAVGSVRGKTVMVLEEALGPFLPLEQFSDPEEVRRHFERIHRPGDLAEELPAAGSASPVASAAPAPWLGFDEIVELEAGKAATAVKRISGDWAFFVDHFQRKPVFPLTLLLECLFQLGTRLLGGGDMAAPLCLRPLGGARCRLRRRLEAVGGDPRRGQSG